MATVMQHLPGNSDNYCRGGGEKGGIRDLTGAPVRVRGDFSAGLIEAQRNALITANVVRVN